MIYQSYFLVAIVLTFLAHISNCATDSLLYGFNLIDPVPDCSVYCMYYVDQNANLHTTCSASTVGVNGNCNACD